MTRTGRVTGQGVSRTRVWSWFGLGSCFGAGLILVWSRFGPGLVPVWSGFDTGLVLVWSRFGPGVVPTRASHGPGRVTPCQGVSRTRACHALARDTHWACHGPGRVTDQGVSRTRACHRVWSRFGFGSCFGPGLVLVWSLFGPSLPWSVTRQGRLAKGSELPTVKVQLETRFKTRF